MSIKNVIIVGAGGNLGPSVLDAFLKSSFNVTVLSRASSKSTFPDHVKVIKADYDSLDSLTDAFKGQDAVVSLVGGLALGDQNKLIDGAIKAGVKRFVPSEFGSDTTSKRAREAVPIFEPKYQTVQYLQSREKEISWTSVVTGFFFDWAIKIGFMGFDLKENKATLYDKGKARVSATTLSTVGLAVVKALEQAEATKNQYLFINSFAVSQEEVLAELEKSTGSQWSVTDISADEELKKGQEKFSQGDMSGILPILQGFNLSVKENAGDFSSQGLWNEKLGLPKETLQDVIKTIVE